MPLSARCPAIFLALLAAAPLVHAAGGGDAEKLRQLSQEFSDASASGDASALGRMLDDRVIFMNEGGELATRKDIVSSASPSPKGTSNTLVQGDWKLEIHGNVAVTSFTDSSTVRFHEQIMHARYRSTEVWMKEAGAWRMISSQTMALPDAPPAIQLPLASLQQYAGNYSAGPGALVRISLVDKALRSATNDARPTPLEVEVRDVLFNPAQPRLRRIFERDATGAITGFLARREGHDIRFRRL